MVFGIDDALLAALITATGAIGGGLLSNSGKKDKNKQVSTQTKQQQQFQNNLIQQAMGMAGPGGGYQNAMGMLQQYLNPQSSAYNDFEAPYRNQFEEHDLPQLAERFAGAGALRSSGFGQAIGGAQAGLNANLAGLKEGVRRNSIQDILGQYNQLASTGLGNPQFSNVYKERGAGLWGGVANAIPQSAGYFADYLRNRQNETPSPNTPLRRNSMGQQY
jgi:hypothetical protein